MLMPMHGCLGRDDDDDDGDDDNDDDDNNDDIEKRVGERRLPWARRAFVSPLTQPPNTQ